MGKTCDCRYCKWRRKEISLLFKEMGGDDLINKIQETFEKRWGNRK